MKKILQKCTQTDFEYLSDVLDSFFALTNDKERKELLAQAPHSPTARQSLITLMDKQIRYYGSADVAFLAKKLIGKEGEISTDELVRDVANKCKVKIKFGASTEKMLELLVQAVVEKELLSKSPEKLKEYFEKAQIGESDIDTIMAYLKDKGKVAVLPILLQVLGSEVTFGIIQTVVIAIIAQFIGREAAKKIIEEIAKRNPLINALGPLVWGISGFWLAFDLQGPAYRKTIPICLYLGIVALRDGEEKE